MTIEAYLHAMDADNHLIKRWDNTPHFPDLPEFPDHMDDGATGRVTTGQPLRRLHRQWTEQVRRHRDATRAS